MLYEVITAGTVQKPRIPFERRNYAGGLDLYRSRYGLVAGPEAWDQTLVHLDFSRSGDRFRISQHVYLDGPRSQTPKRRRPEKR